MSLAIQNNNPGNLKDPTTGQFRTFSTPQDGYVALMNDLQGKVTGATSTGLTPTSTLYDFAKKYAPTSDNNNPADYTVKLANQLKVRPDTPLSELQSRIPEFAQAIAQNEDSDFASKYPIQTGNQAQQQTSQTQEQPKEGFLSSLVSSITDPISQLGGSVMSGINTLTGGVLNKNAPIISPQHQVQGLTGNAIDTFGYRGGQALGGVDTAKQVAGNILENASNVILPEAKGALVGGNLLKKAYQGAKTFGKIGALQGGGQALEEGKGLKESAREAIASGLTSSALGTGLGLAGGIVSKGINAIKDTGIFQGTKGLGERAKQEFVSAVDSGLGKYGKGTGETMFDYGIDHNQTGNDAAYQIRNEIADKAEKNLTEVLKKQNNYTSVNEWLSKSLANIKSGTGNYGAIKTYIENHINDIIESDPKYKGLLIKKASGEIALPDWALNELKQQNWVNSRFNPLGDPASTIKAEANQAMGRAGRSIIEENTKNLNVGEYNKELGRLYNAADVLEKKGDKPIFNEKSSHLVSKILGGLVGSHQGIIGTIIGAQTADAVATQLAKLPMYLRKEVAQKFAEKGKSQLFEDAVELLDKMEQERLGRLSLPSPDLSTYPIPMGAKATPPVDTVGNNIKQGLIRDSNILKLPAPNQIPIYAKAGKAKTYKPEIKTAKKGLVGQNPKTGKFFGTFTSQ